MVRVMRIVMLLLLSCGFAAAQASASKSAATKKAATPSAKSTAATPAAAKNTTAAAKTPPDVIILKGAPMGGVKFLHTAHSKDRNIKCETCHHPAKTESPVAASEQRCTVCHTPVAKAPMKTKRQAAFHNPTAKSGICIDCHLAENAKGKKAPTKCQGCHQKANA